MAKLVNFTRKTVNVNVTKFLERLLTLLERLLTLMGPNFIPFDLKSGILPLTSCTYSEFESK